jgi:hypothetical protein
MERKRETGKKRKRNFLHELIVTFISTGEFTEGTRRKIEKLSKEMWDEYDLSETYESVDSTKLLEEEEEEREGTEEDWKRKTSL